MDNLEITPIFSLAYVLLGQHPLEFNKKIKCTDLYNYRHHYFYNFCSLCIFCLVYILSPSGLKVLYVASEF